MKKFTWIILLLLLWTAAGCSGKALQTGSPDATPSSAPVPSAQAGEFALLPYYPMDVLPLFHSTKVTYCMFETNYQDVDPLLGPEIYTLRYNTSASQEDALAYYGKLLTYKDEEMSYEETLCGKIGDHPVLISVYPLDGAMEASLNIGLTEGQSTDANPYFESFPNTIEVKGGDKLKLYSMAYERYDDKQKGEQYDVNYTSELTVDEFTNLYVNAYKTRTGFSLTESDININFSFTDGANGWTVYYTKPGGDLINYLTIECTVD